MRNRNFPFWEKQVVLRFPRKSSHSSSRLFFRNRDLEHGGLQCLLRARRAQRAAAICTAGRPLLSPAPLGVGLPLLETVGTVETDEKDHTGRKRARQGPSAASLLRTASSAQGAPLRGFAPWRLCVPARADTPRAVVRATARPALSLGTCSLYGSRLASTAKNHEKMFLKRKA